MASEIYNIPLQTIDGAQTNLGAFEGKVLLIVNVASKCGLTPQYEGLQKLYSEMKESGFEVLGFPANNYLEQEPGSAEEIKDFCSTTYDVTFPMFAKLSTKGDDQLPLYRYLTEKKPDTDVNDGGFEERLKGYEQFRSTPSEVLWNFEKFLIDRTGNIVARFAPDVAPDDSRLVAKIKEII
jgi:glutathione peroxidase